MRAVYRLGQILVLLGVVVMAGVFVSSLRDQQDNDPRQLALREFRREAGIVDPEDARDRVRGHWAGGAIGLVVAGALVMHLGRRGQGSALPVTTSVSR